jgi:electron transfer flavoprotein beta subunit
LPSLRDILQAGRKPVTEWHLSDLGRSSLPENHIQASALQAPPRAVRKNITIPGAPADAARDLLAYLHSDGIL